MRRAHRPALLLFVSPLLTSGGRLGCLGWLRQLGPSRWLGCCFGYRLGRLGLAACHKRV